MRKLSDRTFGWQARRLPHKKICFVGRSWLAGETPTPQENLFCGVGVSPALKDLLAKSNEKAIASPLLPHYRCFVASGLRINNCFSLIDKTRGRSLSDALLCKALNTYN